MNRKILSRNKEGIAVGQIDAIISISRSLSPLLKELNRDELPVPVIEALKDLTTDEDVLSILRTISSRYIISEEKAIAFDGILKKAMQEKTVQVVMLPTKDNFLFLKDEKNKLHRVNDQHPDFIPLGWDAQHLNFISDDEIKEGDYYINFDFSGFATKVSKADYNLTNEWSLTTYSKYCKKIIASTDPSLNLTSIPEEWIRTKYVPSNGKIDKVRLKLHCLDTLGLLPTKYLELTDKNEVVIVE